MVTLHFITHTQDYHTHVYSKIINFSPTPFSSTSNQNINPSPRTGPQDLLVTHYDCEENEQKTLHKYAINQVSQCETEPQAIGDHRYNSNTLFTKPEQQQLQVINSQRHFPKRKYIVHKSQTATKTRLDHESFYQSNIERLLHLNPDDCKNELLRLNITQNKNSQRKLVNFQVFSDSVHQSHLKDTKDI